MTDAAAFSLINSVLGRYELRSPLGAGGFGEVYRAWDRLDDQEVAVKVLRVPDHLSEQAREVFIGKFQEEAKLTRKVFRGRNHVRQVFDVGLHALPDGSTIVARNGAVTVTGGGSLAHPAMSGAHVAIAAMNRLRLRALSSAIVRAYIA